MIDLINFIIGFILSIGFAIGLEILIKVKGIRKEDKQVQSLKIFGVYILFFFGALLIGNPLFALIPYKLTVGFLLGYVFGIINLFQRVLN